MPHRPILTADDIDRLAEGEHVELPLDALLTPAARDRLRQLGRDPGRRGGASDAAPACSTPRPDRMCITPDEVDRIAQLVRARLGEDASEAAVEHATIEVLRSLPGDGQRALATLRGSLRSASQAGEGPHLIVSLFGSNRPGIVAGAATVLAELSCDIADMSQTILGGAFAMIMEVDTGRAQVDVRTIHDRLEAWGRPLGVSVIVLHEGVFLAMHRI